jgi:hypothetical protein
MCVLVMRYLIMALLNGTAESDWKIFRRIAYAHKGAMCGKFCCVHSKRSFLLMMHRRKGEKMCKILRPIILMQVRILKSI